MKVVFYNGAEAQVTDVSSVYSLGINSVDQDDINAFEALLTQENLKSFSIVNEAGETTATAENFISQGVANRDPIGGEEPTTTQFMLRPMTDTEIHMAQLEEEKELQAEAIAELAEIIAESM